MKVRNGLYRFPYYLISSSSKGTLVFELSAIHRLTAVPVLLLEINVKLRVFWSVALSHNIPLNSLLALEKNVICKLGKKK